MAQHDPVRRQEWAGQTPHQILERYRPGKAPPLKVLDVLLELFNAMHTSLDKTVSHKTRHERALFLRRFFRDLNEKAGFKKLPDPRNLGQKHLRAMVQVWRREHLAPATIQTYLSFLRGLGVWTGKHGFVRGPAYYGLNVEEYQRHEYAQRDKSWSANGVDIDALVAKVCEYDLYVGASLRLIRAMGLRRKESVLFRPYENAVAFADTGLPHEQREADRYVWVRGKGGRIRHIPLDRPARVDALAFAQQVVSSPDAHMGDPSNDLKKNLRRFDYVLEKFGITFSKLGVTAHGLRHEFLIDHFESLTGHAPPVRGGDAPSPDVDAAARKAVSWLAGHSRTRASCAYLGKSVVVCAKAPDGPPGTETAAATAEQ
jgi:site-specific recombinase XerC